MLTGNSLLLCKEGRPQFAAVYSVMLPPAHDMAVSCPCAASRATGIDDDAISTAETNDEDEEVRLLRPAGPRAQDLDPDFERELAALTLPDHAGTGPAAAAQVGNPGQTLPHSLLHHIDVCLSMLAVRNPRQAIWGIPSEGCSWSCSNAPGALQGYPEYQVGKFFLGGRCLDACKRISGSAAKSS